MTFKQIVIRGRTMGTFYTIKIVVPKTEDESQLEQKMSLDITKLLEHLNLTMSTYIDSSELSLFNKYEANEWFDASRELVFVINQAARISNKSKGAFDITVGPLVNLWGFGPEHNLAVIPEEQEILHRKKRTGYFNIQTRLEPPALKKNSDSMYCDLSAIAKGYGVDKVAQFLGSKNIFNYMVDIGGEIRANGHNVNNNFWRIGVSSPDDQQNIQKVISIKNTSVATSGDYRNHFEKDGIRYSHTIDPRTGKPITHKLTSVTVVHDSCIMADALATAIDVLGPEEGFDLAKKEKLAVYLIIKGDNEFIEKMTPEFKEYIVDK